jgi:hypothetical protein
MRKHWFPLAAVLLLAVCSAGAEPQPYKNFKVTVFIPVQIVERMGHDPAWMESSWNEISSRLHVDKVFIENYRSGTMADDATLDRVKQFFQSHGVEKRFPSRRRGISTSSSSTTFFSITPRPTPISPPRATAPGMSSACG